MKIEIAEGKHRDSKYWKNKTVTWEWFKEKCSEPHRTAETMKEYLAETPERQSKIKDCCGAFVGANLQGNSRSKKDVVYRTMLTLDADFATTEFWDEYLMWVGYKALIYSTHKHTPEKPRLRLCVPFSRPVTVAEYKPIARMIAKDIGIEQIDPTSYDVNRLMYYPSASSDGDYVFEYIDGETLDPDIILKKYKDYNDIASWPTSSFETKELRSSIIKKGNPTEIKGFVGVYCRTYSIEEAIEQELADYYVKSDIEGRYTYVGATGYNGLAVYDGLFAYSNHSSDPAGGKLWNAFDLVRIHKFGNLDDNVSETTNFNKYPSHQVMEEYARQHKEVKFTLLTEREHAKVDTSGDFEDLDPEEFRDSVEWKMALDFDKKFNLYPTSENIDTVLNFDPNLRGKIRLNEFSGNIDVIGGLPWNSKIDRRPWADRDMAGLRNYFGGPDYKVKASDIIKDSFQLVADRNSYHPVKDYLNSVVWDGTPRVNNLLRDYMGAADTELNSAFIRKVLVAAVSRIFRPGTKFDNVIVLVGTEGKFKSTFFRKLGQEWFSDSFNFNMLSQGVRALEQIQNKWIIEIPEMAGLKKADVEAAKSFIASSEDYYRAAYGENMTTSARQCIFCGTSNKVEFLISKSGDRRFWPVDIGVTEPEKHVGIGEDGDLNQSEVNQIWAEAVQMYHKGEKLGLSSKLEKLAKAEQVLHSEGNENSFAIDEFLNSLVPKNWYSKSLKERLDQADFVDSGELRSRVCATEIAVEGLGYSKKDVLLNRSIVRTIHDYMRTNPDWIEHKGKLDFGEYGKVKGYLRQPKVKVP